MMGVPFVVAANYGFIKKLHEMGFKTYNTLWDESYDDITDADLRFNAIAELVNKLSSY